MKIKALLLTLVGTSLLATPPALAGTAGQKSTMIAVCRQAVGDKHLKSKDERQSEYQKCMSNPQDYK